MIKISIKYAAICGVFLTIIFHVSFFFGSNPLIDLSHLIFDLIMMGLFVFFADKEFKFYHTEGYFHFWQGMTIGFVVYTLATLVFAMLLFAYFEYDENALVEYKEAAIEFLVGKETMYIDEFGQKALEAQRESIKTVSQGDLILSATMKKIMAGFFITPVISIILRKQPK